MEYSGIFNLALAAAILVWCPLLLGQFERRLNPQEALLHWALRLAGILAVISVFLPAADPVAVMTILPWTAVGLAIGGLGLQKLWRWGLSGNANSLFGWACLLLAMSAVELARNRLGRTDLTNVLHLIYGGFLFLAVYSLILVRLEKTDVRSARRLYTLLFLYLLSEFGYLFLRRIPGIGHDMMALALLVSSLAVVAVVVGARTHLVKSSLADGLLAVATISGVVANGIVLASQMGLGPFQGFDGLVMTHGILTIFAWMPAMCFFVMVNKYYCRDHRSTVPWIRSLADANPSPEQVGLRLENLNRSDFTISQAHSQTTFVIEAPFAETFARRIFSGVTGWMRSQSMASAIFHVLGIASTAERFALAVFQNAGVGYLQAAWLVPGGHIHLILLPQHPAEDPSQLVLSTFDADRSYGDQGIYLRGWFPPFRLPLDCHIRFSDLQGRQSVTIDIFLFGGLIQSLTANLTSK